MQLKPKIRIAIVDAGKTDAFVTPLILPFIKEEYGIELTSDYNADYVFHSCLDNEVLKYTGIRIYVTGENVSPNFNISDYALAFDPIEFGDRYCRLPLIKLYRHAYQALCQKRAPAESLLNQKDSFCAYVVSNLKDSAKERVQIVDALSKYKTINLGGKWRNNVGKPVSDKIAFQSKHKFVIAFENSSTPGYLTEKFAEAAQSNAIPIYWGDPHIAKTFNSKAFINCHDYDSFEAVTERVKEIDQNDTLYLEILNEPWFIRGIEPPSLKDETFKKFLKHIFDQDHGLAYRRNRSRWGIKHERRLYNMAFRPLWQFTQLTYKQLLQKIRKR